MGGHTRAPWLLPAAVGLAVALAVVRRSLLASSGAMSDGWASGDTPTGGARRRLSSGVRQVECVRNSWPSLLPERDVHMRALTQQFHGCKPIVVRATRLAELSRDASGRWLAAGHVLAGPEFPVPRHAAPRANAANAMTQARMMQVVSRSPSIAAGGWVLLLENDAVLHTRARKLPPGEVARIIHWATAAAERKGLQMVHFALCPFATQPYTCTPVHAPGGRAGWPSLHTCTGDARCATAYALTKERARLVASAWAKRRLGVHTCPLHVWGGEHCPRDPWLLSEYLAGCTARQPALACRSLIVGYDWGAGQGGQRGLFLQDRAAFGSTIDSKKSADHKLVRVPH